MEKEIFTNEFVVCKLDDEIPVLVHTWLKKPSDAQFRSNLHDILKEYKHLKKNYENLTWLANTKRLGEVSEDTENWLLTEWDEVLFEEAEVKVHAVILGSDIYSDYPMEKFKITAEHKFREKGVRLGVFAEEKEAYDWLREKYKEVPQ